MMNFRVNLLAITVLAFVLVGSAGCTGTAGGPTGTAGASPVASAVASTSASPTPAPVAVTTPEQAVAQVILAAPRLAGIQPFDPDLIGQSSWYKVAPASGVGAFVVTVRVGWGDCPAGCIDEHQWVYAVGPDGAVSIVSESGEPVPAGAWPAGAGGRGQTGIGGTATAGPVCPVEKIPPDPSCAPRPVGGAVVVIRDGAGVEITRATTAADGTYFVELAPGTHGVEAQPVTGLMGTPASQSVTVSEGATSTVDLGYDTGIR
jgi:hypothetical protein